MPYCIKKVINMRRFVSAVLTAVIFSLIGVNANAQESATSNETQSERRIYMPTGVSCIDGPRFEIVIPRNNNTPYLRLDKETGEVLQLRQSLGSKNYAKAIEREPSEYDIRKEGQNNYQIVAESPFHIYLMNINTGLIWEYSDESIFSNKTEIFRLLEIR